MVEAESVGPLDTGFGPGLIFCHEGIGIDAGQHDPLHLGQGRRMRQQADGPSSEGNLCLERLQGEEGGKDDERA